MWKEVVFFCLFYLFCSFIPWCPVEPLSIKSAVYVRLQCFNLLNYFLSLRRGQWRILTSFRTITFWRRMDERNEFRWFAHTHTTCVGDVLVDYRNREKSVVAKEIRIPRARVIMNFQILSLPWTSVDGMARAGKSRWLFTNSRPVGRNDQYARAPCLRSRNPSLRCAAPRHAAASDR